MASGSLGALRRGLNAGMPVRLLALAGGTALVLAVGGCATVPGGSAARSLAGSGGQPQAFVQPVPPPGPDTGWSAEDVIQGFLSASASFALDPKAAEQYLMPGVTFQPGPVTVVSNISLSESPNQGLTARTGSHVEMVSVSGQRVASLSPSGQYQYPSQPGATSSYPFTLTRDNGVWRIQSLPKVGGFTPLLLSQTDFNLVFQPRNLYFYSAKNPGYLVPDPVFAPVQGPNSGQSTTSDLAKRLVEGLISGPQGPVGSASWLSQATTTFPLGTELVGKGVSVSNLTATVNLSGPAEYEPPTQLQMYAQLWQTLTGANYGATPIATSVVLEFNGDPVHTGPADYGTIPAVGDGDEPLYFAAYGGVWARPASGGKPVEVVQPAQLGFPSAITAVAASRAAPLQVAVAAPYSDGCAIEVVTAGKTGPARQYPLSRSGGHCSSLSWDSAGDLWAVAGSKVWLVQTNGQTVQPVNVPTVGPDNTPARVVAMRVAPDDARAALLVQAKNGNKLYLAAVSYSGSGAESRASFGPAVPINVTGPGGSNLPSLIALGWYSPDDLAVLGGSELYEVPLTGGQASTLLPVPPGTTSFSTDGSVVAASWAGRISTSGLNDIWLPVSVGSAAAFPG